MLLWPYRDFATNAKRPAVTLGLRDVRARCTGLYRDFATGAKRPAVTVGLRDVRGTPVWLYRDFAAGAERPRNCFRFARRARIT